MAGDSESHNPSRNNDTLLSGYPPQLLTQTIRPHTAHTHRRERCTPLGWPQSNLARTLATLQRTCQSSHPRRNRAPNMHHTARPLLHMLHDAVRHRVPHSTSRPSHCTALILDLQCRIVANTASQHQRLRQVWCCCCFHKNGLVTRNRSHIDWA